jgi:hypothetical protein
LRSDEYLHTPGTLVLIYTFVIFEKGEEEGEVGFKLATRDYPPLCLSIAPVYTFVIFEKEKEKEKLLIYKSHTVIYQYVPTALY